MNTKLLMFEWQYHSRQTSFILSFLIFISYGFLAIISEFDFLGYVTKINSSYNISLLSGIVTLGAVITIMFLCVNGLLRDSNFKTEGIVFTTGLSKKGYFISRFIGVFFSSIIISSIFLIGFYSATWVPSLDETRIANFNIINYIWPLLILILPNIFICTAILFTFTIVFRSVVTTFLGGLLILISFWVCSFYINSPLSGGAVLASQHILDIFSIVDLFGLTAFFEQTQFWTPFQKDNLLISFSGHFLFNRVAWISIGVVFLGVGYKMFSFRKLNHKSKKKVFAKNISPYTRKYHPVLISANSRIKSIKTLFELVKMDLRDSILRFPFMIMIFLWVILTALGMYYSIAGQEEYGGRYPTTNLLVGLFIELLPIMGLFLIIFYAGELVWKTSVNKMNEIFDATPVPNSLVFSSKLIVLTIIPMFLILSGIIIGLAFQVAGGYFQFQIFHFLSVFYYSGIQFLLYVIFVLFIQIIASNKYIGMLISGLIILVFGPLSSSIGIEHPLLQFNNLPSMARAYSDITGYGQYVKPFNWLAFYWMTLSGVIIIFGSKLWNRGVEFQFFRSIKHVFKNWSLSQKIVIVSFLFAFLTSGSYIYYNVNVVNEYTSSNQKYDWNEKYEKKYKKYGFLTVPRVVDIKTKVDIFPDQQKYIVEAEHIIKNHTVDPLKQIFVTAPIPLRSLSIENCRLEFYDEELNVYLFSLNSPFIPNQQLKMNFVVENSFKGFKPNKSIQKNGTYIKNSEYKPMLGYVEDWEIHDSREREKRGLEKKDLNVRSDSHFASNSKFNFEKIQFETIISTSSDQKALSSGDLLKQWEEKGRKYYHFKTNSRIPNVIAYFSSKYESTKLKYNDIDIELFYHKGHHHNNDEILNLAKTTLDYCTENFAPYPHKYLRIAEIPGLWGPNGQAMAGVISLKETSVFTKDTRNQSHFNNVARIIIHEISHQWWGHQLTPKRVEGAIVIAESLAKYTEAVVLEKLYGKAMVRKLTNYTLRRYFTGRAYASNPEPPLYLTLTQQYLGYSKGYSVFNALKELIGEESLNKALKSLLVKYSKNSEVTSLDLIQELYEITPVNQHQLIDDLMKKVITYDLKITNASSKKLPNGKFELKIGINSKRYETIDLGEEKEIAINEQIQIGLFNKNPGSSTNDKNIIYLEKHLIDENEKMIILVVDQLPKYVGVDPFLTRLDKDRRDNIFRLDQG